MKILIAISSIFFAGMINGSFVLPTKHVAKWRFENIWLNFAFWGFIVLPWSIALYLEPQVLQIYANMPRGLLLPIAIGGVIFGISQVCFALSMEIIGIGLGFVINLGIGIGLGFALPLFVQYPQKIPTLFGVITLIGTTLAIIGLIIANYAGMLRDRDVNKTESTSQDRISKNYIVGLILAILAGLGSAGQNFTFSYTHNMQDLAREMGAGGFVAANIIWPVFLLYAVVPYIVYMLYLHYKNSSFNAYRQKGIGRYYLLAAMMGMLSYGSILIYSRAAQLIGELGPVVGWPIFMVVIILTSNFWGWRHHEWQNCGKQAKNTIKLGIGFLIIAVTILGYSSTL